MVKFPAAAQAEKERKKQKESADNWFTGPCKESAQAWIHLHRKAAWFLRHDRTMDCDDDFGVDPEHLFLKIQSTYKAFDPVAMETVMLEPHRADEFEEINSVAKIDA